MGIVSAVARQVEPKDPMVYIQTDTSINPGTAAARWSIGMATWSALTPSSFRRARVAQDWASPFPRHE
jgi:hypothetical protein